MPKDSRSPNGSDASTAISITNSAPSTRQQSPERKPAKSKTPEGNFKLQAPEEITYFPDTIFVGGLPHCAQRSDVMKRFSKFGKIKKVVWPMLHDKRLNRKRPKGFAYVVFKDPACTAKVIAEHERGGVYLAGYPESRLGIDRKRDNTALTRQMRSKGNVPTTVTAETERETETEKGSDGKLYIKNMVFIGSIPHAAQRDDIEEMFSKYGKIKKIVWPQTIDRTLGIRRHKGFAYVIFFEHADSLKAVREAAKSGGRLCLPGHPDEPMAVERKLDRPRDEQEKPRKKKRAAKWQPAAASAPAATPKPAEYIISALKPHTETKPRENFESLYQREVQKNQKLQKIIKAQQIHIRQLEQNQSSMSEISKLLIETNTGTGGWGQSPMPTWRSNVSERFTMDSVTAVEQRMLSRTPRSRSPLPRTPHAASDLLVPGRKVDLRHSNPGLDSVRSAPGNERSRSASPPKQPQRRPDTYSAFGSKEVVHREGSPDGLLNLHEMLFSQQG